MNATRQDAWSKEEDLLLADTVLTYIREGRTQLEAFKEVAGKLDRTSAACGFRWNASIRKQYDEEIQKAKQERKLGGRGSGRTTSGDLGHDKTTIETAILLLDKMKAYFPVEDKGLLKEQESLMNRLQQENRALKQQLNLYEETWKEMEKLWKNAGNGQSEYRK
ncbi:RsfA family transcriptional regulator [Virgibacillus xinjiangensis]|uniref:RsfA family transcriptional regulator n=1 Tax=Virgibacillus xinjiangensis TaxID=393090 RepID=A0ABV7CV60_9BACI